MIIDHFLATGIIQGLWLILTIYWLVLAFHTKKTVYQQSWAARLGYVLPIVIAYNILLHWSRANVPLWPISPIQRVMGIVLCAGGIGFAIWARTILGTNWSGIATVKEKHELICRGPYSLVRHPIYTGLLLAYVGTALALWPTAGSVIMLAALISAAWIKSRQEEKLMLRQFPDAYGAYRQKVRGGIFPRYSFPRRN
ncbi:MAG: isoprenylcysteine carboxylmethyltransferase family protein [Planctomycetes bacterium]|jgi:protein-S-isoprenylcysteine O-methyltransferase Ste14|nr:isoprenylcysteine carboxylmethyltransferase family protein [Planctomycetota bacterium]